MQLRAFVLVGIAAVFTLTTVSVVRAGGASVTCTELKPNDPPGTADVKPLAGTGFCKAQSDGGPAKATASGNDSQAVSTTDVQGNATSKATANGIADADGEDGGAAKATAGGDSSSASADALGDHPGTTTGGVERTKATAKASNGGEAVAHSAHQGSASAKANSGSATADDELGGVVKATSLRNGTANASSFAVCFATAGASDSNSDANATCDTETGIAKANARRGGDAKADANSDCTAQATADGKGTHINNFQGGAQAECFESDSVVIAKTTGGGVASGSDLSGPICDIEGGGTAQVKSPGGDCKKP